MSNSEKQDDAVLDLGESSEPKEKIEKLRARINEQEKIIESQKEAIHKHEERLNQMSDTLLDLSARIADSGGAGVCMKDSCHGALLRVQNKNGDDVIKCSGCGETVHEY